jgi:SAM-dependent methyltransferase
MSRKMRKMVKHFDVNFYTWKPKTLQEAKTQIINPAKGDRAFDEKGKILAKTILEICPSGRRLDFGCGIGRVLRYLPDDTDGYEPNEGMRQFIPEWIPDSKHKIYTRFQDLPKNCYDCIFEILVFQHIQQDEYRQIVRDLRRILKKGGLLIIGSNEENGPFNLDEFGYVLHSHNGRLTIWRNG